MYYEAAASDIDPERQTVACEYQQPNCSEEARRFTVPYDVLVVAVRSKNIYKKIPTSLL